MSYELPPEVLTRMNIGRRYWPARKELLPPLLMSQIAPYLRDLRQYITDGVGLYLYGDNGVGKTYASAVVLKEAQRLGIATYCVLASELKGAYIERKEFEAGVSIAERCERVTLLALDDVGKEYTTAKSGWAEQCFETLLRKRTREMLPVVYTSNLPPSDFSERYGRSTRSILTENTLIIHVTEEDQRSRIRQRNKEEYADKRSGQA